MQFPFLQTIDLVEQLWQQTLFGGKLVNLTPENLKEVNDALKLASITFGATMLELIKNHDQFWPEKVTKWSAGNAFYNAQVLFGSDAELVRFGDEMIAMNGWYITRNMIPSRGECAFVVKAAVNGARVVSRRTHRGGRDHEDDKKAYKLSKCAVQAVQVTSSLKDYTAQLMPLFIKTFGGPVKSWADGV